MSKSKYETPSTEVLVVRIERTILSVDAVREGYGPANPNVSSTEKDSYGNWSWN